MENKQVLLHRVLNIWSRYNCQSVKSFSQQSCLFSSPLLSHVLSCPVAQLNPMSHTQHCVTSMGAPSWNSSGLEGDEVDSSGEVNMDGGEGLMDSLRGGHGEGGLSFLLKQEDTETQDAYIYLYSRLDVAVREMKQYVAQIDV